MSLAAVNAIATILRADSAIMADLPGLVWTREIKRNVADGAVATPGSTPEAFDSAGRIRRCLAIIDGPEPANDFGPPGAYIGAPRLVFYCQPKETEKERLDAVIAATIARLRGRSIPIDAYGAAAVVRIAGRDGFQDDPVLTNAVYSTLTLQLDGVWWKE